MSLSLNPLSIFIDLGKTIIDKVIPDKAQAEKAKIELEKTAQSMEFELVNKQLEINNTEAKHPSIFVAGARPAALWVCVIGLCYDFLGWPLLSWLSSSVGIPPPPTIDNGSLMSLLGTLLGLGTFRTLEALKGVKRDRIKGS